MVDNFDADIHSPNGRLSTRSPAMILTQPSSPGNDPDDDTIERLKHSDVKHPIDEAEDDAPVYYVGWKKPHLPRIPAPLITDKAHQRM